MESFSSLIVNLVTPVVTGGKGQIHFINTGPSPRVQLEMTHESTTGGSKYTRSSYSVSNAM